MAAVRGVRRGSLRAAGTANGLSCGPGGLEMEAQWAQCTTVSTLRTASPTPSPVSRSPLTVPGHPLQLITRTPTSSEHRRSTTLRPSVPVPPVIRTSDGFITWTSSFRCGLASLTVSEGIDDADADTTDDPSDPDRTHVVDRESQEGGQRRPAASQSACT